MRPGRIAHRRAWSESLSSWWVRPCGFHERRRCHSTTASRYPAKLSPAPTFHTRERLAVHPRLRRLPLYCFLLGSLSAHHGEWHDRRPATPVRLFVIAVRQLQSPPSNPRPKVSCVEFSA